LTFIIVISANFIAALFMFWFERHAACSNGEKTFAVAKLKVGNPVYELC